MDNYATLVAEHFCRRWDRLSRVWFYFWPVANERRRKAMLEDHARFWADLHHALECLRQRTWEQSKG